MAGYPAIKSGQLGGTQHIWSEIRCTLATYLAHVPQGEEPQGVGLLYPLRLESLHTAAHPQQVLLDPLSILVIFYNKQIETS